MKVVVSLPGHERPEIVINQIQNVQYYMPEAVIVLHISAFFEWNGTENMNVFKLDNVLINPERIPTVYGQGMLPDVHNSNFKFALKNTDFDYFTMHSSNDMFIKNGVKEYIANYDAGVNQMMVQIHTDWPQKLFAEKDPVLAQLMKHLNIPEMIGSQIEGTFYKTEIFKEMVEEIERFYSYKIEGIPYYAREELYYPIVASKFVKNFGIPYTYMKLDGPIPIDMIDDIRSNNIMPDIYNVKRVLRDMSNPVRVYINSLMTSTQTSA